MQLTTLEIAQRCQKTERTVQRWIQHNKIKALHIQGNLYEVSEDDLQRFLPHEVVDSLNERISALEDRVRTLEGLVTQLTTHLPKRILTPPRATYKPSTASESSTLPDGYTPIADLIKQYNAPETSVMRNMRPYLHPGKWKTSDGRTVNYALDAEGLAEFQRRYVRE